MALGGDPHRTETTLSGASTPTTEVNKFSSKRINYCARLPLPTRRRLFKTNFRSDESVDLSSRRFFSFDRFGLVRSPTCRMCTTMIGGWFHAAECHYQCPLTWGKIQKTRWLGDLRGKHNIRPNQFWTTVRSLRYCVISSGGGPTHLFRRVRSIDRGQFPPPHLAHRDRPRPLIHSSLRLSLSPRYSEGGE